MKKVVLVLLLLLIAGYIYWPYHAVGQLETALRLADREALEKRIDFAAVRESMKAQIAAKKAATPVQRLPGKGLQQDMIAAAGLAPDLLSDTLIDQFTPENLSKMLQVMRLKSNDAMKVNLGTPSWTGANTCTTVGEDKSIWKLKLTGIDGWRVVSFEPGE